MRRARAGKAGATRAAPAGRVRNGGLTVVAPAGNDVRPGGRRRAGARTGWPRAWRAGAGGAAGKGELVAAAEKEAQGVEACVATCGHVGSDVVVHIGSQYWSEVFWTSSDTLE